MASQLKDAAWLEWIAGLMGAGSRQTQTSTLPPSLFHCLLDELPVHLIPRHQAALGTPRQPLFLNPECYIPPTGQLPAELEHQRSLLQGFDLQNTIAWVRDPITKSLQPFWLGHRLKAAVAHLRLGYPAPDFIPSQWQRILARAGILISESHVERRIARWNKVAGAGQEDFSRKNYALLPNLIHPFHIAALRRYYRQAIRTGQIRLGDEQSSRRYVAHDEPVARFFHHQIATAVSGIIGETIQPSYVYFASYLNGAELKKHIDRDQCEFSVTLCLDFSPEPELATPWPIRLETSAGPVVVYQALGDGLVYRGTKVPHYRTPLPQSHTSTSIFFHYVPANFVGCLK